MVLNTVAVHISRNVPVGLKAKSELKHLSILLSVITFLAFCWCLHNVFLNLLQTINPQSTLRSSNFFHGVKPITKFCTWFLSKYFSVGLPIINLMVQKISTSIDHTTRQLSFWLRLRIMGNNNVFSPKLAPPTSNHITKCLRNS